MKTKEELLKIYSAYLPYGLEFRNSDETYQLTEINVIGEEFFIWACHRWDEEKLLHFPSINVKDNSLGKGFRLNEIKPILYSMEMLTQEIEHNGERFVPIEFFDITDDYYSYPIEYDHGNIKLIKELESIAKHNSYHDVQFLPFEVVQRLISWHFNVFGLEESEYIKKEYL